MLTKEKNILNAHSSLNKKSNILKLINKNETNDKNFSLSNIKNIYSLKKRILSPNLKIKKIKNIKKMKLKSTFDLHKPKDLSVVNDESKHEVTHNNEKSEKNEKINENNNENKKDKIKEKENEILKEMNIINALRRNSINMNNIYNNFNLNQKRLFIINGKNITLRNSLANLKENNQYNIRKFVKLKALNLGNNNIGLPKKDNVNK